MKKLKKFFIDRNKYIVKYVERCTREALQRFWARVEYDPRNSHFVTQAALDVGLSRGKDYVLIIINIFSF